MFHSFYDADFFPLLASLTSGFILQLITDDTWHHISQWHKNAVSHNRKHLRFDKIWLST